MRSPSTVLAYVNAVCRSLTMLLDSSFLPRRKRTNTVDLEMKIRTSTSIKASMGDVWPLLTKSRMDVPGLFCLGLPQPKSCELANEVGGVGLERRCISDRGVVIQRITEWSPPTKLTFEMVRTDHTWSSDVESLQEEFTLVDAGDKTKVTRHTTIKATGFLRLIKEAGFYLGLKRVHLYVFKNWRATAE